MSDESTRLTYDLPETFTPFTAAEVHELELFTQHLADIEELDLPPTKNDDHDAGRARACSRNHARLGRLSSRSTRETSRRQRASGSRSRQRDGPPRQSPRSPSWGIC